MSCGESDGKSAYERLKRETSTPRMILPFGTAVMFRVAGWLGTRFCAEEHIVAQRRDGLAQIEGSVGDA